MTRRDEGRGEGGMRGNAPEAKGQLSFAVRRPSPSVLPSFFPLPFSLHSVFKKHLIAARLLTSKFKEAKMTSSLSRFAMFFTQKKRKFMEIIMVLYPGGCIACLLGF